MTYLQALKYSDLQVYFLADLGMQPHTHPTCSSDRNIQKWAIFFIYLFIYFFLNEVTKFRNNT